MLHAIRALTWPRVVRWIVLLAAAATVLLGALSRASNPARGARGSASTPEPRIEQAGPGGGRAPDVGAPAARQIKRVLPDVKVVSHGELVWRGTVDLSETLAGIESGKNRARDTFQNRERRLPVKPRDYYREFVQPTPGVSGAGSQRIVRGEGGELFYTADHYQTFVALN